MLTKMQGTISEFLNYLGRKTYNMIIFIKTSTIVRWFKDPNISKARKISVILGVSFFVGFAYYSYSKIQKRFKNHSVFIENENRGFIKFGNRTYYNIQFQNHTNEMRIPSFDKFNKNTSGISNRAYCLLNLVVVIMSVCTAWTAHSDRPLQIWNDFKNYIKISTLVHGVFKEPSSCKEKGCKLFNSNSNEICSNCALNKSANDIKNTLDPIKDNPTDEDILSNPEIYYKQVLNFVISNKTDKSKPKYPNWYITKQKYLKEFLMEKYPLGTVHKRSITLKELDDDKYTVVVVPEEKEGVIKYLRVLVSKNSLGRKNMSSDTRTLESAMNHSETESEDETIDQLNAKLQKLNQEIKEDSKNWSVSQTQDFEKHSSDEDNINFFNNSNSLKNHAGVLANDDVIHYIEDVPEQPGNLDFLDFIPYFGDLDNKVKYTILVLIAIVLLALVYFLGRKENIDDEPIINESNVTGAELNQYCPHERGNIPCKTINCTFEHKKDGYIVNEAGGGRYKTSNQRQHMQDSKAKKHEHFDINAAKDSYNNQESYDTENMSNKKLKAKRIKKEDFRDIPIKTGPTRVYLGYNKDLGMKDLYNGQPWDVKYTGENGDLIFTVISSVKQFEELKTRHPDAELCVNYRGDLKRNALFILKDVMPTWFPTLRHIQNGEPIDPNVYRTMQAAHEKGKLSSGGKNGPDIFQKLVDHYVFIQPKVYNNLVNRIDNFYGRDEDGQVFPFPQFDEKEHNRATSVGIIIPRVYYEQLLNETPPEIRKDYSTQYDPNMKIPKLVDKSITDESLISKLEDEKFIVKVFDTLDDFRKEVDSLGFLCCGGEVDGKVIEGCYKFSKIHYNITTKHFWFSDDAQICKDCYAKSGIDSNMKFPITVTTYLNFPKVGSVITNESFKILKSTAEEQKKFRDENEGFKKWQASLYEKKNKNFTKPTKLPAVLESLITEKEPKNNFNILKDDDCIENHVMASGKTNPHIELYTANIGYLTFKEDYAKILTQKYGKEISSTERQCVAEYNNGFVFTSKHFWLNEKGVYLHDPKNINFNLFNKRYEFDSGVELDVVDYCRAPLKKDHSHSLNALLLQNKSKQPLNYTQSVTKSHLGKGIMMVINGPNGPRTLIGKITKVFELLTPDNIPYCVFEHDIDSTYGYSGAPIYLIDNGAKCGIHKGGYEGVNRNVAICFDSRMAMILKSNASITSINKHMQILSKNL